MEFCRIVAGCSGCWVASHKHWRISTSWWKQSLASVFGGFGLLQNQRTWRDWTSGEDCLLILPSLFSLVKEVKQKLLMMTEDDQQLHEFVCAVLLGWLGRNPHLQAILNNSASWKIESSCGSTSHTGHSDKTDAMFPDWEDVTLCCCRTAGDEVANSSHPD